MCNRLETQADAVAALGSARRPRQLPRGDDNDLQAHAGHVDSDGGGGQKAEATEGRGRHLRQCPRPPASS